MKKILLLLSFMLLTNITAYTTSQYSVTEITDEGEQPLQRLSNVRLPVSLLDIIPHELLANILKNEHFEVVNLVCKPFYRWAMGYDKLNIKGPKNSPDRKLPLKGRRLPFNYGKFTSQQQIENTPSALFYTLATEVIDMPWSMLLRVPTINIDTLRFNNNYIGSIDESPESYENLKKALMNAPSITNIIVDTGDRLTHDCKKIQKVLDATAENQNFKSIILRNNSYLFNKNEDNFVDIKAVVHKLSTNKNLMQLSFVNNKITDDQINGIVNIARLENLDIHNNRLTDKTLVMIQENILSSNLQHLDISSNPLTKNGIIEFLRKIPNSCRLKVLNFSKCVENDADLDKAIQDTRQAKTDLQIIY